MQKLRPPFLSWKSPPRGALAVGVLVAWLGASGCSTPPVEPHRVVSTAPEKDVLHFVVEVPSALEPRQYLQWTEADLATSEFDPENPVHPEFPIHEIFYSFHAGPVQLATVQYRRDEHDRAGSRMRHIRTLVYGQVAPAAEETNR